MKVLGCILLKSGMVFKSTSCERHICETDIGVFSYSPMSRHNVPVGDGVLKHNFDIQFEETALAYIQFVSGFERHYGRTTFGYGFSKHSGN